MGQYSFTTVYAPSGSQNRRARQEFFDEHTFILLRSYSNHSLPALAIDFNSILPPRETEQKFPCAQGKQDQMALIHMLTS